MPGAELPREGGAGGTARPAAPDPRAGPMTVRSPSLLDTASDSGVPEDAWPASGNRPDDRLARVAAVVHAFARGEIVVVSDDDDREDEGDLFVAAEHCTPERMAFIIRHTSGIVCAPLSGEVARRLRLDPMVAVNDAPLATAFTVSVDVRRGLRTGISAEERCATVRALAHLDATADDFVRPGHVFPLIAREGGVLIR